MAWETRERGGTYYTRSRRLIGRVVREYIGTGPVAEMAAELDAIKRREREAQTQAVQDQRRAYEAYELILADLAGQCDDLVSAALLAAGYHEHRGEWRKRRDA